MTNQAIAAAQVAAAVQVAAPRDLRLRVGVLAADPLRLLGLQTLFAAHTVVAIVPLSEADLPTAVVDLLLVAAQTPSQAFESMAAVRSRLPSARLLVMAAPEEPEFMARLLRVGANGYLPYTAALREMEDAIAHVYDGEQWLPARVLHPQAPVPLAFTARERQVLALLTAGNSNREIGNQLNIEERTVKSHVARLLRKMGVRNRTALTMQAISLQLLDQES